MHTEEGVKAVVTLPRRQLGRTGLEVTPLCVGTSPLASMPRLYGYEVEKARAVATVRAVFDSPVNFVDTSNGYGDGESERRIGEAIATAGGLPNGFVLATKVDPDPITGNFSGERVRISVAESLERLGLERLQLLALHDPERISFEEATGPGGALEALVELRTTGVAGHIGVAGGPVDLLLRYIETGAFDFVLTHNRFTLLNRTAQPLFDEARRRGMGVLNAAPYGGGIFAKGPDIQPKYAYREPSDDLRERVLAMAAACASRGVPLAAAALQFSMRDQRVDSTVVGLSSPERISQTLELAACQIPDSLWDELQALAPGTVTGLD